MKRFQIILTISVSDEWIENGVDFTREGSAEAFQEAVNSMIPMALPGEIKVDVQTSRLD